MLQEDKMNKQEKKQLKLMKLAAKVVMKEDAKLLKALHESDSQKKKGKDGRPHLITEKGHPSDKQVSVGSMPQKSAPAKDVYKVAIKECLKKGKPQDMSITDWKKYQKWAEEKLKELGENSAPAKIKYKVKNVFPFGDCLVPDVGTKLLIHPKDLEGLKNDKNRFAKLSEIQKLRTEKEKLHQENMHLHDFVTYLQKQLEQYRKLDVLPGIYKPSKKGRTNLKWSVEEAQGILEHGKELGRANTIKEVKKVFTKLSDENGSWGDFERKFTKALKDLKEKHDKRK